MRNAEDGRLHARRPAIAFLSSMPTMPQNWRKMTLALVSLFLLGGCAVKDKINGWLNPAPAQTAPPQPAAVAEQLAPAPKPEQKPKHEAKPAHEEKAPEKIASIDPSSLIGLDPSAVERILGLPKEKKAGDPSLVWTYSDAGCSFELYFFPDLKTGAFHVLKYGGLGANGAQIALSQECIRNILAVKAHEPS